MIISILEARAEILTNISLVFWVDLKTPKKTLSRLTDLYLLPPAWGILDVGLFLPYRQVIYSLVQTKQHSVCSSYIWARKVHTYKPVHTHLIKPLLQICTFNIFLITQTVTQWQFGWYFPEWRTQLKSSKCCKLNKRCEFTK